MAIISADFFKSLTDVFCIPKGAHIAVGVSGGADSLCLTVLLSEWAKQNNVCLTAITVNHRLRSVAEEEAYFVAQILKKREIEHVILTNETPIPETGLEVYSRQVLYGLIYDYCKQNNITHLFLAHHQLDQAETFLLRLGKKTGLTGLSGMRSESSYRDLTLCRPFLTVPKSDIIETLQSRQIHWIEDEMNADEKYERVKWRHFLPVLAEQGISAESIVSTMKRLTRADEAIKEYVSRFIQKNVWIDFRGFARLPVNQWMLCPEEVRIQIIQKLINIIAQEDKPVSLQALEDLCLRLPVSATLGGCVFVPHKTGLYIGREKRLMAPSQCVSAGSTIRWDRFLITPFVDGVIDANAPEKRIENIPYLIQNTFPAFYMQKSLEKKVMIDYKEKNDSIIRIEFVR